MEQRLTSNNSRTIRGQRTWMLALQFVDNIHTRKKNVRKNKTYAHATRYPKRPSFVVMS